MPGSVRFERLGRNSKAARQNAAHFIDQPSLKHVFRALVEPRIELLPRRRQTDFEDFVTPQFIAPFLIDLRNRTARQQAHFERAHQFGKIVGVNAPGGLRIETSQQPVVGPRPAAFALRQPVAQRLIARRSGKQAIKQRAQIKARATGHHGKPPAGGDFREDSTRQARIFARREQLVGIENVDQMMRDAVALIGREFGGTDVKIPEYL